MARPRATRAELHERLRRALADLYAAKVSATATDADRERLAAVAADAWNAYGRSIDARAHRRRMMTAEYLRRRHVPAPAPLDEMVGR